MRERERFTFLGLQECSQLGFISFHSLLFYCVVLWPCYPMDQELEQQKATIVSFGSTLHDDHVAPTQPPPPPPPPQQTPASPQQEARTTSRSSSSTSLNVSDF